MILPEDVSKSTDRNERASFVKCELLECTHSLTHVHSQFSWYFCGGRILGLDSGIILIFFFIIFFFFFALLLELFLFVELMLLLPSVLLVLVVWNEKDNPSRTLQRAQFLDTWCGGARPYVWCSRVRETMEPMFCVVAADYVYVDNVAALWYVSWLIDWLIELLLLLLPLQLPLSSLTETWQSMLHSRQ